MRQEVSLLDATLLEENKVFCVNKKNGKFSVFDAVKKTFRDKNVQEKDEEDKKADSGEE
jgi:hypothetical protein